jgi:hypothetical protein
MERTKIRWILKKREKANLSQHIQAASTLLPSGASSFIAVAGGNMDGKAPKKEKAIEMDATETIHFSRFAHSSSLRSSNTDMREIKETMEEVKIIAHNLRRLMVIVDKDA